MLFKVWSTPDGWEVAAETKEEAARKLAAIVQPLTAAEQAVFAKLTEVVKPK